MVTEFKIIEGKKYMWDGKTYENDKQAKEIKTKYEKDGSLSHFGNELYRFFKKYVVENDLSHMTKYRIITEILESKIL